MSLDTSSKIFTIVLFIGFVVIIYFLIKDRIDIVRSIKPKSIGSFFGLDHREDFINNPLFITLVNLFALVIWVPIWILDKLFKLNIFKQNNP